MVISHVHIGVRNLAAAVSWFDGVLQMKPSFQGGHMATFLFGEFTVILDEREEDSPATLGFSSSNCDADYHALLSRGAISLAQPKDQPWGARVAYVKGPAALTIEFEQLLPSPPK